MSVDIVLLYNIKCSQPKNGTMKSLQKITAVNAIWALSSALLIFLFINWLAWSLLPSVVLGIALYLHTIYLSKVLNTYYYRAVNKGMILSPNSWFHTVKKTFLGTGKESESEA